MAMSLAVAVPLLGPPAVGKSTLAMRLGEAPAPRPRPYRRGPPRRAATLAVPFSSAGAAPMTAPGPGPTDNSWVHGAVDHALAYGYQTHTATLRGVVRQRLVTRALLEHLPTPPGRLLDVGGGNGVQARVLARLGYEVTILDPDEKMLDQAAEQLSADDPTIRDRVSLTSRGHDPRAIRDLLVAAGTTHLAWHGIRVFTDHLGDIPPGPDLDTVLEVERRAGERDPYRQVARLYHLLHERHA